jgi:hypothetical protein
LFSEDDASKVIVREVQNINPYLVAGPTTIVQASTRPSNGLPVMMFGNMPRDDGQLLFDMEEAREFVEIDARASRFMRDFVGSEDAIHGGRRRCIWVSASEWEEASRIPLVLQRFQAVAVARRAMKAPSTQSFALKPYRFVQIQGTAHRHSFLVPRHSSEHRKYLPVALYDQYTIVADSAFAIYDAAMWAFALLVSRIHLVWIANVCGKIKTDFRYSNTLGWNTFPTPRFTEKNKADMSLAAERILVARERYFPAALADLYEPDSMPLDLREAHELNDELIERMYIGRRFRNDSERLEELFSTYANPGRRSS